jgi:hypothetical protein
MNCFIIVIVLSDEQKSLLGGGDATIPTRSNWVGDLFTFRDANEYTAIETDEEDTDFYDLSSEPFHSRKPIVPQRGTPTVALFNG